jgi:hypothetical protein
VSERTCQRQTGKNTAFQAFLPIKKQMHSINAFAFWLADLLENQQVLLH